MIGKELKLEEEEHTIEDGVGGNVGKFYEDKCLIGLEHFSQFFSTSDDSASDADAALDVGWR